MIVAGKYEIPDTCPEDCVFYDSLDRYGQGSICYRCPVLICSGDDPPVPPEHYRGDWAFEWKVFFENGTVPDLMLRRRSKQHGKEEKSDA